jgi:hypothetical protein
MGLFMSSHIDISGSFRSETADTLIGYDYVKDIFGNSDIFSQGWSSLQSFFGTIFNSFGAFLEKGFFFFVDLYHKKL